VKRTIIILICIILFSLPAFSQAEESSKPLEVGITFDWISKTQMQRDENIAQIQNVIFGAQTDFKYPKKQFKEKYKAFLNDGDYLKNYIETIYYYDAMGNLRWIDSFSDNYPSFPYSSCQYNMSGKLVAGYYYLSDFDQYVFDENKKFKGRWYKENLYNKRAKVVMKRSSW